MSQNIKSLKNLYLLLFSILVFLIVLTPYLISDGLSFLDEEMLEVIVLFVLTFIGFLFIIFIKKKSINSKEN